MIENLIQKTVCFYILNCVEEGIMCISCQVSDRRKAFKDMLMFFVSLSNLHANICILKKASQREYHGTKFDQSWNGTSQ